MIKKPPPMFCGLAMMVYLKNIRSTFVQLPNRLSNIEFTTVCTTIANRLLTAVVLVI
jgi:hypothetical protein